jgi:SAM-dependent methyltransferase
MSLAPNPLYPVRVKPRRFAEDTRPEDGGPECFDTPAAVELNRARLEHVESLELCWEGKSVLDVGCGVGHLAGVLAGKGCQVVGVDGREENILVFRERHPELRAEIADVEGDLRWLGAFDIVFCFGLLYHLENPIRGLRNMAAVCREFLIVETIVCDHELPVAVWDDETKSANQALLGLGCRPSPSLVAMTLNRIGFPLVYAPIRPPHHPEFEVSWTNSLAWTQNGHVIRSVFVASRAPLDGPHLSLLCGTMPDWCCQDYYGGEEIPDAVLIAGRVLHNSTLVTQEQPLTVVSPPQSWAYSIAFPIHRQLLPGMAQPDAVLVKADLTVHSGEVRLAAVTHDLTELLGAEAVLTQEQGRRVMEVCITCPERCGWVVLRNGAADCPAEFEVHNIAACRARKRA